MGAAAVTAPSLRRWIAQTTATGPGRACPRAPFSVQQRASASPFLALGGWHIGAVKDEKEAIKIMHAAIDEGMTFFDNAWDYHDGGSEEIMGKALAMDGKRKKVFLMTKNCARDAKGTRQHLEDSLRRLQTDVIDLWQFHEINYDNDPDWIVEKGGAGRGARRPRRKARSASSASPATRPRTST